MHELGITQNILDIVLEHAERAGATRVIRVNLVLGDLADVTEESIRFYWEIIARGTPAEGATLVFQHVSAKLRCAFCGTVFTPRGTPSRTPTNHAGVEAHLHDTPTPPGSWCCPQCGQPSQEVLAGREFRLDSIEVGW